MYKKICVILLTIILIFSGIYIFQLSKFGKKEEVLKTDCNLNSDGYPINEVKILLPAVKDDGDGMMVWLSVDVYPGSGRTLIDINNILFWEDTQESIRLAKEIAGNITGKNLSNFDLVYFIDANASKIEGPSAGPAVAIATIFALENKTLNNSVVISGYLRSDGRIGRVSGLLEKAQSAKENGVKLFIVPKGQRYQIKTETIKKCDEIGFTTFCRTETFSNRVDIEEEVGIDVVEVERLSDAIGYFNVN
ncbi:MAG: S16 family serine protease [Candidatus Aenigmatarchaeota archaeon]